MSRRGQGGLYEALLADGQGVDRAQLAAQLGMEAGALRVALHLMRKRLRDHIENEVLETIGPEADLQAGIKNLLDALGQRG